MSTTEELENEITCSICLEYFVDPVITKCGHNFCQACLPQFQRQGNAPIFPCPHCRRPVRRKDIRRNRQLANMVEIIKLQERRRKRECRQLFCKDDQALLCEACNRFKEHEGHTVVPVEEAVQEYKEKIKAQIQTLEKKKEKVIARQVLEEEKKQKNLAQVEVERKEMMVAFKKMQQHLKEKMRLCLVQLGDQQKAMEKRWKENTVQLSGEVFCLKQLIYDMEQKCQEPASEFLQDIGSTLHRYEERTLRPVVELSSETEETLKSGTLKILTKAMGNIKDSLEDALQKESLNESWNKVNVILDPDTAHPFLILSEDLTQVSWKERFQDLPENSGRFNREFCVLGYEGFTRGSHCWVVEVEEEKGAMWALGVARESVQRKGIFRFNPNEGLWVVGKKPNEHPFLPSQLSALTSPQWTPLAWRWGPQKIQVFLHYEAGQVKFFDAESKGLIFAFSSASFSGQRIRPFFWVGAGVKIKC